MKSTKSIKSKLKILHSRYASPWIIIHRNPYKCIIIHEIQTEDFIST